MTKDRTEARGQEPGEGQAPIERAELERRVLFSLLGPVVVLIEAMQVSLKELTSWVRIAYFKHLREQGMSLAEIGEVLDVSERTAKGLSRQLRESFFLPEREHNLPTRIEFMLWRLPMSERRLNQVMPNVSQGELRDALDQLLEEGRIIAKPGRTVTYEPTQSVNAQIAPAWVKRIGGLNSLLGNVADTVRARFFDDDERGFARTMSFYLKPADFAELQRIFAEVLVPAIATLDEDAHNDPDALPVRLSLLWAPYFEELTSEEEDRQDDKR